jgi:hypothetical protein
MEVNGQLHGPAGSPPVLIGQETGWAPELVSTLWSREKSLVLAGNGTPVVQSASRRYTD